MLIFSKEIRAGTALFNGAILDEFNAQHQHQSINIKC